MSAIEINKTHFYTFEQKGLSIVFCCYKENNEKFKYLKVPGQSSINSQGKILFYGQNLHCMIIAISDQFVAKHCRNWIIAHIVGYPETKRGERNQQCLSHFHLESLGAWIINIRIRWVVEFIIANKTCTKLCTISNSALPTKSGHSFTK